MPKHEESLNFLDIQIILSTFSTKMPTQTFTSTFEGLTRRTLKNTMPFNLAQGVIVFYQKTKELNNNPSTKLIAALTKTQGPAESQKQNWQLLQTLDNTKYKDRLMVFTACQIFYDSRSQITSNRKNALHFLSCYLCNRNIDNIGQTTTRK